MVYSGMSAINNCQVQDILPKVFFLNLLYKSAPIPQVLAGNEVPGCAPSPRLPLFFLSLFSARFPHFSASHSFCIHESKR